jgi:hypothetical protein
MVFGQALGKNRKHTTRSDEILIEKRCGKMGKWKVHRHNIIMCKADALLPAIRL